MCRSGSSSPHHPAPPSAADDDDDGGGGGGGGVGATAAPTVAAAAAPPTKDRIVTRSELSRHNTPLSAWTSVHGRVVDVTDFASRHPGGDLILLAAGRDATALVESYHPRGVPDSLLDRLQVGAMKGGEFPSFYTWSSDFYPELKRRVLARLDELGLPRRGGPEIWIKAFVLLTGFWYCLLMMYSAPTLARAAIWSAAMGAFASFVGTCVQHDGNHGAFATSGAFNRAAGWTLDMIGASAFTWEFQHMLGHHPYTNLLDAEEESRKGGGGRDCPLERKDQESDPDVFSSFPAMRMHPLHRAEWYHRYQHIYGPVLFAFMTLSKVYQQDVQVVLTKRLYHIDANCRYGSALNVIRFWTMKVASTAYMLAMPCYIHGIAGGVALFLVGHFTCGEVLATMFIVNHVIEGVSFAEKGGRGGDTGADGKRVRRPATVTGVTPMERTRSEASAKNSDVPDVPLDDWAAVQCQTSVNWSPGSWFWNHFSGGLSHQIEHHLFPGLCHTNYVHIQDVVESACREYGVPYQTEPSLLAAYGKMLRHLKFLGTEKKEG